MNIRQLEDQIKSESLLFTIIKNNDIEKLKLLINDVKPSPNLNAKNNNGDTPLRAAIENKNILIVAFLIEAKADVNAKNHQGETPLFAEMDDNCLQLLLRARADLSATDNNNNTPLMRAARCNRLDAVRLLLSAKSDVTIKNKDGQDAIALASCFDYDDLPYGLFKRDNPTKKLLEAAQPNHYNRSRQDCRIL